MKEIKINTQNKLEMIVTEDQLASKVGSGAADVFATPMMVALMENSAMQCLADFLDEGETSVGIEISVSHTSATPLGMNVYAISTITAVDGRKVDFDIEAFDECGKIGTAKHSRFVVNFEKFMQKTNAKLKV
jgi:predicted thioesterase